jgi:hypothetical protein
MICGSLRLVSPLIILLLSIPLATFAIVTTWIAVSTLLLRASIVYFELGIALVHGWFFVESPAKKISPFVSQPSSHSSTRSSPTRRRHRRGSVVSNASSAELSMPPHKPAKSDSFVSLVGAGEPNRDFEGVGGWRLSDEASEEALWIGMNSRLELPAAVGGRVRKHQRSLTGGTQRWSWGPESIRMSPVQSRARTPNASVETLSVTEGYFMIHPLGKAASSMTESIAVPPNTARRKSYEGSSTSSASSSRTPRKTTKQAPI